MSRVCYEEWTWRVEQTTTQLEASADLADGNIMRRAHASVRDSRLARRATAWSLAVAASAGLMGACHAGAGGSSDVRADSDAREQVADSPLRISIEGDSVVIADEASGRALLSPNGGAAHRGMGRGEATPASTVRFEPLDNGFDVIVRLRNEAASPIAAGEIAVGGFRFGNAVGWRDFRYDGNLIRRDATGRNFFGSAHLYPEHLYSPVAALSDGEWTVGLSLLYSALDAEHSVRIQLRSPGGPYTKGGKNWEVGFGLLDELAPGEEREYRLAVRLTRDQPWISTLAPYREFFQQRFPAVEYTRDPRAVAGVPLAQKVAIRPSNPFGYVYEQRRPDLNGWDAWAQFLAQLRGMGYTRMMLWAPTGLFDRQREYNYPFLFATPMNERPMMRVSKARLRAVAEGGVELGLWWGRSQQVMFGWDEERIETLDPDNAEHRDRAFAELDAAVALGARAIGLDAFAKMPHWEAFRWLKMLKERAPGVKFIVEPAAPDFLHALAPMYMNNEQVNTRPLLADYLLPGNEIWIGVRFDLLRARAGRNLSEAERLAAVQRVASLGFVPVVFAPQTVSRAAAVQARTFSAPVE